MTVLEWYRVILKILKDASMLLEVVEVVIFSPENGPRSEKQMNSLQLLKCLN